ncbi:NACHT domain-containing protein [Phragmitibacter flavus]|nr:NACHT domain-containing protein [Phragmitibacter flavus]
MNLDSAIHYFCKPVVRHADRFVELDPHEDIGFEVTPFAEIEQYLKRHFTTTTGPVEIAGRSYTLPVFVPKNTDKICYVLVDGSGLPTEESPTKQTDTEWITEYSHWIAEKLSFSEGLAKDQAAYLETEFLSPSLSEVDPYTLSSTRSVTWEYALSRKRCVLLGEPGTGKTTLLRRWALNFCKDVSRGEQPTSIPVYFQLRDWQDEHSASHALNQACFGSDGGSDSKATMRSLCRAGRVVLLLDGLDEVPDSKRQVISDMISRLANDSPMIGIILSTRTASYKGDFQGFSHCLLRPFEDSHMLEWSYKKLYSHDRLSWHRFVRHLNELPQMKDAARNPFLLGLLVHFYRQNSVLPKDSANLLSSYVRALSGEWDMVRGISRSSESWAAPGRKLSSLCRLAFWLVDSNRSDFSTEEFCSSEIKYAERDISLHLLPALVEHTGLLQCVDHHRRSWKFSHRTLMELFAANYLVERADDVSSLFVNRWANPTWRSIWVYACGLAQDAGHLVQLILNDNQIAETHRASLLARAFAQNLNMRESDIEKGCAVIMKAVDDLLRSFKLAQSREPIAKDVLWCIKLKHKESLAKWENFNREEAIALLCDVYAGRSGVLGKYVRSVPSGSESLELVKFLEGLSQEGDFKVNVVDDDASGTGLLIIYISIPEHSTVQKSEWASTDWGK